jgi:hypothetical protein
MTVLEASERMAEVQNGNGRSYIVCLLTRMVPEDYVDRYPPPGEDMVTRLRRWFRRRRRLRRSSRESGVFCHPIVGATLDERDRELLLWHVHPPTANLIDGEPVSVDGLHAVSLKECSAQQDYNLEAAVYWRARRPNAKVRSFRLDWPILGFAADDKAELFGLLAGPGWEDSNESDEGLSK